MDVDIHMMTVTFVATNNEPAPKHDIVFFRSQELSAGFTGDRKLKGDLDATDVPYFQLRDSLENVSLILDDFFSLLSFLEDDAQVTRDACLLLRAFAVAGNDDFPQLSPDHFSFVFFVD